MKYKMSKGREILFLAAIFLSNIIIMDDMILTPLVNELYEKFPGGSGYINFCVSGCLVIVMLVSLIVGRLCSKYDMKTLMIVGAVFGAVGGIGQIFSLDSALMLAVCRGIVCIGYALTMNVAFAILTDMYTDEDKRSRILGYNSAFMQLIGMILTMLAGILAVKSLKLAFSLHYAVILYIIMLVFFVPSFKPVKGETEGQADEEMTAAKSGKKEPLGLRFWSVVLNYCIYSLGFCVPFFYISVYVAENAIGNTSTAGLVTTMLTFVSFVTPFGYGKLHEKLGGKLSVIGYAASAVGSLILMMFPTKVMTFIGYGVLGAASPLLRTALYDIVPKVVPESRINDGISLVTCMQTVFTFGTTYFITFGMALLKCETFTSFLIVSVIILAINIVWESLFLVSGRKQRG